MPRRYHRRIQIKPWRASVFLGIETDKLKVQRPVMIQNMWRNLGIKIFGGNGNYIYIRLSGRNRERKAKTKTPLTRATVQHEGAQPDQMTVIHINFKVDPA